MTSLKWNFIEFRYLCHFFPHLLLSAILVKTARLKNFNSLTGLIPPSWWHFSIYIIFLILIIMFYCIKLSLNKKIHFWGNNIFICIYIAINCKIDWRLTPALKLFKLCCIQLKRIIVIRLASCLALRNYAVFPEAI